MRNKKFIYGFIPVDSLTYSIESQDRYCYRSITATSTSLEIGTAVMISNGYTSGTGCIPVRVWGSNANL